MSERKREVEEEASSTSVSPLKKTKLNDSDSSSHDVVVVATSSSSSSSHSFTSSAASASDKCSDDRSSSISSGCFSSESKEIAKNRSTLVTDLEAHQNSGRETKTSTLISSNFRKETSTVSEGLGETTTEMESSSATKRTENRRKPPEGRKTPTPKEIEEFFSELEEKEDDKQKQFIEKYNFDIVNDEPLEGRYKWDRLNP